MTLTICLTASLITLCLGRWAMTCLAAVAEDRSTDDAEWAAAVTSSRTRLAHHDQQAGDSQAEGAAVGEGGNVYHFGRGTTHD